MNRRQLLAGSFSGAAVLSCSALSAQEIDGALEAVGDARFIAIGERHDNPDHHRLQAELVAVLNPSGLAFEMLNGEQATKVNALRRRGTPIAEIGESIGWADSGWPDWSLYAAILDAAPDAVVIGGALAQDDMQAVYSGGASSLKTLAVADYGLDQPLYDEDRQAMLDEQFEAHCEMIERDKLGAMVEVQRAWDASYADALRRAGRDGLGVLICGNAHARLDRGAPAYLKRKMPDARIASIGLLEDGDVAPPEGRFSVTLTSPRPERGDPCEKMRAAMEKG